MIGQIVYSSLLNAGGPLQFYFLLWMEFSCLKVTETLRGDSLLFTIKFPGIFGTHLMDLRRMKNLVDLGATHVISPGFFHSRFNIMWMKHNSCSFIVLLWSCLAKVVLFMCIEKYIGPPAWDVPEAAFRRCSVKQLLLVILQNSLENTCARVSFLIKLQALSLQLY